jgi:acyl CoA:acetate/3-ketoacid CoA transferase alpha subunit
MTLDGVIGELRSGMTIGIGGWGSRRKPMALVRALAASDLADLTIVSYGGPDVGLLVAAGKVRRLVTGFVSLDSIPLEPHFRRARQRGAIELTELDEGMLHWGLLAAAHRRSCRCGPGSVRTCCGSTRSCGPCDLRTETVSSSSQCRRSRWTLPSCT